MSEGGLRWHCRLFLGRGEEGPGPTSLHLCLRHSLSCRLLSPPPSFSSLPQAPRIKADVFLGEDAHMWITWGDSDDPYRVERLSLNPTLNTTSNPPPKDPDAALFLVKPYINKSWIFKQFAWREKNSVMRGILESPRINRLIIQIGGGGLFLIFFLNRETFHPIPSLNPAGTERKAIV